MTARHAVRRLFALAALGTCLAIAPAAFATNYVCDCGQGADANCAPGSDSNSGTSPSTPWRTLEAARSAFSSLPAGGETRFCRGGSFGSSPVISRWDNRNCSEENRCVIADYTPVWASGDEGRPILRQSIAGSVGFSFDNGGAAIHTGNVLLENFDMRGDGTDGANAIFFYNDANNYEIRNMRIDSWKIGIQGGPSSACSSRSPRCNGKNDEIRVYDSTITNNTNQGWLGRASNGGLYNNYWEGNGGFKILDHNIYYSHGDNFTISGNRLYRAAQGSGTVCGGASLAVHGTVDNLLVENNEIWEDIGGANQACWGIGIDNGYSSAEAITNLVVRGNVVRNVGNVGIGVAACSNCLIENNIVISEQAFNVNAITAPDRSAGAGDIETTQITVRNNSIFIGAASGGTGINVGRTGSNHTIISNAILYEGTSNFNCMLLNTNTNVFTAVGHNVCYYPNASSSAEWADGMGNLASWQSRGLGQGSMNVDPQFADPANGDLSAASANSNIVNAGDPNLSSSLALWGAERTGSFDIGAFEYGAAMPDAPIPTPSLAAPFLLE